MHSFGIFTLNFLVIAVMMFNQEVLGYVAGKMSATPDKSSEDYMDYQLGVKYDEYPMIVPKKRTAMLVDRLMVALKEAIDEEEAQMANNMVDNPSRTKTYSLNPEEIRTMDLQRRGHGTSETKARPYWRCYFNAVTCF